MSEKNRNAASQAKRGSVPAPGQTNAAVKPQKKKSGLMGRIIRRFFLLLFTVIFLVLGALILVMNLVFNGPSPAAREVLTMSLSEASATKWVPGMFMDQEVVDQIRHKATPELEDTATNVDDIVIKMAQTAATAGTSDEWRDHPDGIYIEEYSGKTFNAHIMTIRDPSRVYMAVSSRKFSTSTPGTRITEQIETEGAIAAINAGAFYDDGTASPVVGSVPAGLVLSGGEVVWDQNHELVPAETGGGFCGFNDKHVLVVAKSMTAAKAKEMNIVDGCEFGPVLIMNGEVNQEAYNKASGYNPRTAIAQREDGTVIFLCIDGRQAGSLGGTYRDIIDILIDRGAYNACNMDGGSSSVMLYRDTQGLYGEPGQVQMINNYSLLQSSPRRMPNFWMVRPESKE